jgi:hypothetical protein
MLRSRMMSEDFKTLTSDVGVSLEVSHHFSEIPEAERGPVALAAWVDPWPDQDQFRPNLVVEVELLTPATATIQQLNTRTMAAQIALGRYLVGCDYVPAEESPGDGPARGLVAIYPALGTTVVQWQRVAILGNRAVIVTMQAAAANYAAGTRAFAHALRTLRFSFADPPVEPDPELMPSLDPLMLERGEEIEDLSGISAAQAPADGAELEPLDQSHFGGSERRLVIEIHEQGAAEPVSVVVPQRLDARPVALARLLRVAPAWILGFSDAERSGLIDRTTFEARLRDPSTPPPARANDALLRVWDGHWRLVTIGGRHGNGILVAETAGAHGFKYAGDDLRLTPMGTYEILRPILRFGGFELG